MYIEIRIFVQQSKPGQWYVH